MPDFTPVTDNTFLPFGDNPSLSRGDDVVSGALGLTTIFEDGFLFGDTTYSDFFINSNGRMSFESTWSYSTFVDYLTISPFATDLYLDGAEGAAVTYDFNTERDSVVATWSNVPHLYDDSVRHNFQMELMDLGEGDAEIIFRYGEITGTSSSFALGANAGSGPEIEVRGGTGNGFVAQDLATTRGNSGVEGVWQFSVIDGQLQPLDLAGEDVVGTDADEEFTGSFLPDIIDGAGGNDTINGAGGGDSLQGGDGDDQIGGGGGDDTIDGGAGDDTITDVSGFNRIDAGDGNDMVSSGDGSDWIDAGAGNDTVNSGFGFDTVHGGDGDDEITLSPDGGRVFAGDGNDLVTAQSDYYSYGVEIHGMEGNDTVGGTTGNDIIAGQSGNDLLAGGSGSDYIFGGEGDDFIWGGESRDFVWGGAGADKFYASERLDDQQTRIMDYDAAEGDTLVYNGALADRSQFRLLRESSFGTDGSEITTSLALTLDQGINRTLFTFENPADIDQIVLRLPNADIGDVVIFDIM